MYIFLLAFVESVSIRQASNDALQEKLQQEATTKSVQGRAANKILGCSSMKYSLLVFQIPPEKVFGSLRTDWFRFRDAYFMGL